MGFVTTKLGNFVELCCRSCYSFLRGVSDPKELVKQAKELGMEALGLTDLGGLYAAPLFYKACKREGIHPVIGAEVEVEGGFVTLLCESDLGYANLCQLLTASFRGKGEARATPLLLKRYREGLIALSDDEQNLEAFGEGYRYLVLTHHLEEGDLLRCRRLAKRSIPCVVSNRVSYATQKGAHLMDVLTCIRERVPLSASHHVRFANHERYLKGEEEMRQLFADFPEALARTEEIAKRCEVSLDFSSYRFPNVGEGATSRLRTLCEERVKQGMREQLEEELTLIEKLNLAGYFLIVWDIVRFAKSKGIPAQGRGSAANSLVAYLLGITPVNPIAHKLFLGRFIHEGMKTIPDIDLDFAASRERGLPDREDVIRYVYEKYGESHVAMVATFVTFQERSAIREVGFALGLPQEQIDRMAKLGMEACDTPHFERLVKEIQGLPRHLSVHVGGMLIASRPISELVPLVPFSAKSSHLGEQISGESEGRSRGSRAKDADASEMTLRKKARKPARAEGRIVCQWDKDLVEDAGLIKVDILGLGMLSVLREAADLAGIDLDRIPEDDKEVYRQIGAADTIGVFQVESRAQMQSLPKTRPQNLPELAVQVAIIRPGPLQGNMVAPYIRRKQGREPVVYDHPSLERVCAETLGVILFQEQILQIAVHMSGFSQGEAEALRRAMSRKRSDQAVGKLEEKFVYGALKNGASREQAERVFAALRGFASYGFCKSHALSFAHIAYRSAYLKRYHPASFLAALLNNQPMGFYPPEVLIEDAKRHGVSILPLDINRSKRCAQVEGNGVRLGWSLVKGVHTERIEEAQPFSSVHDFAQRTGLRRPVCEALILAGAFDELEKSRREALWKLWGGEGDSFVADPLPHLPRQTDWNRLVGEVEMMGFAPAYQVVAFMREELKGRGVMTASELMRASGRVQVAGLLICRQRPPTAKGFAFLTLEDETGLMNIVVSPKVYAACKRVIKEGGVLGVVGVKESRDGVVNIKAVSVERILLKSM